jgi:CheY-like chemotaxis protein
MQFHTSHSLAPVSLLIISDSPDHLKELQKVLSGGGVEITEANSMPEVAEACSTKHDLAVVDVGSGHLSEVLKSLRTSRGHVETTVLVPSNRSLAEPGVLARYRAMPCTAVEMQKLVNRRAEATPKRTRRGLL